MKYLALIGRFFFSAIFILSALGHFSHEMIEAATGQGVPSPHLLVPLSGVISLVGGISILIGYKARLGALLLILFLVPVTLFMHPFWNITDPLNATIQQIMFFKNLSILGGACLIAYFGSGPMSLDYPSPKIYSFKA